MNHTFTNLNKPRQQYRATTASKRVPKIIELTHMTRNNKNVFKHLSNKMMTVIPGKTSSNILSSITNYEATKNYKNPKYGKAQHGVIPSVNNINLDNAVEKQKYNIIRVPSLAEGGVVNTPTLAMVGEGRRGETVSEIKPIDRSANTNIQKTQSPTASSVGAESMDTNAALKLQQNSQDGSGGGNGNPSSVVIDKSTSQPSKAPPDSASFNDGRPGSMAAIQTQTHFPRWRRTLG